MRPRDTQTLRELLKSHWTELQDHTTDAASDVPVPPFQKGGDGTTIELPDGSHVKGRGLSLNQAIAERRSDRRFSDQSLSLDELSYLLWTTQGVRKTTSKATFRTVPSGGARHPLETYLFVSRVDGLEPGLYRYLPTNHQLVLVYHRSDLAPALDDALLNHHFGAAVDFVWTAVPYRSEWKYAWESLRLILLDAGHVCAHLYLAAREIGCGTCAVGAYDQEKLDALLGVDGKDEFAVYAGPVGRLHPGTNA